MLPNATIIDEATSINNISTLKKKLATYFEYLEGNLSEDIPQEHTSG